MHKEALTQSQKAQVRLAAKSCLQVKKHGDNCMMLCEHQQLLVCPNSSILLFLRRGKQLLPAVTTDSTLLSWLFVFSVVCVADL